MNTKTEVVLYRNWIMITEGRNGPRLGNKVQRKVRKWQLYRQ